MSVQPMSQPDRRPSVATLLADPAVRTPVKAVLRTWSGRDPVDAAEDADLLAQALGQAADELLGAFSIPQAHAREERHVGPLD